MTHGSLFSGIGGFDLAAEWMGWTNVFHCEWNPFGQKVLKHYWPDAELFTDITKSNFTKYAGTIDIISGGFPCQPYSAAGKRKGKEDERHLWPYMLDTIKSVRPRWVVGENVLGLVNWSGGLVFHEVQADLEAAGYEVWPYVLPAASVGAPHRRDRVWFVAHSINGRHSSGRCEIKKENRIQSISWQKMESRESYGASVSWNATDTEGESGERVRLKFGEFGQPEQEQSRGNCGKVGSERNAADTKSKGLEGGGIQYGFAYNVCKRFKPNDWENFPTKSPICSGNDGIPDRLDGITFSKWRNESIKAYGNAVVPQVVYQIFKAIQEYENLNP
jgi:DNA (cytosine-5)-methyltransferase 1